MCSRWRLPAGRSPSKKYSVSAPRFSSQTSSAPVFAIGLQPRSDTPNEEFGSREENKVPTVAVDCLYSSNTGPR
jgi:hypothetical protein